MVQVVADDGCSRPHEIAEDLSVNLGAPVTLLIFDDEIFEHSRLIAVEAKLLERSQLSRYGKILVKC